MRHAILARTVADIGETVNLTMLNETEVLYGPHGAPWPLRTDLKPGSRVPLHCSASGKLLLSLLPREQRAALVRQLRLERFTPNTITDVELLEAELDRSAHKQMGVDNEEFVAGISCVAVPVHDTAGHVVAARPCMPHRPLAAVALAAVRAAAAGCGAGTGRYLLRRLPRIHRAPLAGGAATAWHRPAPSRARQRFPA